jgi:hypothetical protein
MTLTERYLSRRAQAERYGRSIRTIERWGEDPRLELPAEIDINGRKLRPLSQLELWERKQVGKCKPTTASTD